jgi:hypothetical protein
MSISKILLTVTLSALLSASAFAQQQAPQGAGAPQGGAPQGGAPQGAGAPQGQPGGGSDSGVKLDMTPFFTAVDTNKDNKVTAAEWKAAGLPENVYDMFDTNKKGSFSKEDVADKTHPPTIDSNKDGKFSLEELKAHIKSQQSQQGSGGAAGGAPGAPGGAQGGPQGGAPQK